MYKLLCGLLLGALLLASFSLPLQAQQLGQCPAGFDHLHQVGHEDDGNGEHQHVGSDLDLNGDGWLCAKHVGPDGSIHVHVDNIIPLND